MSDRRRGLGRGLGALIPPAPSGVDRPSDVFFPRSTSVSAGQSGATALLAPAGETGAGVSPASEAVAAPTVEGVVTGNTDDSLAPDGPAGERVSGTADLEPVPGALFAEIPVEQIAANPRQPRQVFDEDDLAELEHSIREIGVLQPVVVRRAVDGYELIMGERRLRATRNVGLPTIPAIVRETADEDMLRDALLENLHRAQLNPLEEAAAYQQLLDDFGCTHDELAGRLGRSRPQISNTLRLMKLPPLVQRRVAAGVLSAGHARALLGLSDGAAMERLAQRIVAEGLSVRTVEEIVVLGERGGEPVGRRSTSAREPQPELEEHASRLADRLDTRVAISMGRRKGKVTVEFASLEDLDRILGLLATD
ncbi:ParB/RepB/Spo0J family partition protein [Ornithinimicrobium cavernae]|uniref:ParB/RepB/Spo0J family partition protein n=1 Tax=Ornithinimicrobium cavernae TaxID=2666047 RepID=UPI000D68F168|nr:ParB/RepB/Spo0J family partition protein [Ornithinimicrobium cavernae]